jgi:hypothetical protein
MTLYPVGGAITITGGVTSATTGTGISVSGATGAVTFSIDQTAGLTWTTLQTFSAGIAVSGASSSFQLPDAGTWIVKNDDGTAIWTLTDGGAGADTAKLSVGLQLYAGTAVPSTVVLLSAGSGADELIGITSSQDLQYWAWGGSNFAFFLPSGTRNFHLAGQAIFESTFATYNNINTAGPGLAPIYGVGARTLYTNSAPSQLNVGGLSAGTYRLSGGLDVLTASTLTVKLKVTYTDAGGNARTDIPGFYLTSGSATAIVSGGNTANTTGRYTMIPMEFTIDGSQPIIILDNAGTYTTGTYYWVPVLEQVGT